MINKVPIVIASVLKPLNDTRMLYKLGFSMRETNKYDINIIGFSSKKIPIVENIKFKAIFSKTRNHPSRFLAPYFFLKNLLTIKPKIVIVTTYELLPPALIGKLILGFKLIYDIQENYTFNIRYNKTQPLLLKYFAMTWVWFCEGSARGFIDHYLFAEKTYARQFPSISNYTIIENKALFPRNLKPAFKINKNQPLKILITGTIAEVYGIWDAIAWFNLIGREEVNYILEVKGHVPVASLYDQLMKSYGVHDKIHLNLSKDPVDPLTIQEWITSADILLLPYQLQPSTVDKLPTKLYEGIAHQIPILITKNPLWEKLINRYPAGMGIVFNDEKGAEEALNNFFDLVFYIKQPDELVDWQTEKEKFQQLIQNFSD